jgi:hypothetical protein
MKQGIMRKTLITLTSLGTLAALFVLGYQPPFRVLRVSGWIAADVDIAVLYAHAAVGDKIFGLYLHDTKPGTYRPKPYDLEFGGGFNVKEFPDHIFVSWRLPPPDESPYERCVRRAGTAQDCRQFPVVQRLEAVRESGQLVGPFKVPINLSPKAKELIKRRGADNYMVVGVTYGLEPPKLRWILYGDPESGKTDTPSYNELARGGDW